MYLLFCIHLSLRLNCALYSAWCSFVVSSVLLVTYSSSTISYSFSAIRMILLRSWRAFSHWPRIFSATAIYICSNNTHAFDNSWNSSFLCFDRALSSWYKNNATTSAGENKCWELAPPLSRLLAMLYKMALLDVTRHNLYYPT